MNRIFFLGMIIVIILIPILVNADAIPSMSNKSPEKNVINSHLNNSSISSMIQTIWIDPINGNDSNSGSSPEDALATIQAGWDIIPKYINLTTNGYRIYLLPGNFPESAIPGYMDGVKGTEQNPVIIEAVNGKNTTFLHAYLDIQQCNYLSLLNISVITDPDYGGGGNVIHFASCDHILLKGCTLNGYDGGIRQPQEALKANQVSNLTVEDSDISGAFWYALDYVAVKGGHISGCRIHDAGEFSIVIKGGSSDILVEDNQIYSGDTGGISAGSGTGFNWMVPPYIHYEIYNCKFVNNIINDTGTVGISVNGGYNILMAYNTLYKVGINDHLAEVMHGSRGCDGDPATCAYLQSIGGWGTTGESESYIPSADVYIYNNIMYNPAGYRSRWQQFVVQGPVTPPTSSNVPSPSLVDQNLNIRGNMIWNGPPDQPDLPILNEDGGCSSDNPTCNLQQIIHNNTINTLEPQLTAPDHGDFSPIYNSTVLYSPCYSIPMFPGNDRPYPPLAPQGDLNNTITTDFFGSTRSRVDPPGAIFPYITPIAGFTVNRTSGNAPLAVQFNDTSTGSPTAWNWSYGDGTWFNTTTSAIRNVTRVYSTPGSFITRLQVSNTAGTNITTPGTTITVISPLAPTITSISPFMGYPAQNWPVTIKGMNFRPNVSVTISNSTISKSGNITSLTGTRIVCIFPVTQLTPGVYEVTVRNEDLTSAKINQELVPIVLSFTS